MWWAYLLLGLAAGILSATFGVGGGILMVPALVLIFATPQKSAQGMALAVMVPMALVGAARYVMNPAIEVDLRLAGLVALGGVAGALIGAEIANRMPAHRLRVLFAVFMMIVALRMLLTPARPRTPEPASVAPPPSGAHQSHPGAGVPQSAQTQPVEKGTP